MCVFASLPSLICIESEAHCKLKLEKEALFAHSILGEICAGETEKREKKENGERKLLLLVL